MIPDADQFAAAVEAMTAKDAFNKRIIRVLLAIVGVMILIFITALFMIGSFLIQLTDIAHQNKANGDLLIECTTPGPREPTVEDPSTGHHCFDRGRESTGKAIAVIIDANGNGDIDVDEILAAIAQLKN